MLLVAAPFEFSAENLHGDLPRFALAGEGTETQEASDGAVAAATSALQLISTELLYRVSADVSGNAVRIHDPPLKRIRSVITIPISK